MWKRGGIVCVKYLQFQLFYSNLDHFSMLISKNMATTIDVFKYLSNERENKLIFSYI